MISETSSKPNIHSGGERAREMALAEIIRGAMGHAGVISFAQFMELALYHPELGYYERGTAQTGRSGDFYTSVSVGPLYGELLAFDFAHRLQSIPGAVHLVEAGAHDGQFAHDVLSFLATQRPNLVGRLTYTILEPSARRQAVQEETLRQFRGRVQWRTGWHDFSFRGICFSNELMDAMPVHVFRWSGEDREWQEYGVTEGNGSWAWARLPAKNESHEARELLPKLPPELAEVLPEGFQMEVSPAALDWWSTAAAALESGVLMTVDYGLERPEDFLLPARRDGTVRGYSHHRLTTDILDNPGEQDITAHVNFSQVIQAGERGGLHTETFVQQGSFLKHILERVETGAESFGEWTPSRRRQLASLMHPEHLGRAFRVLVQTRES